nr:sperm-associated antigen 16 protein-like isoform X2 [Columba livia]
MWALPDGNITMTGEGHADQLSGCCFYPSGTQLVTSSGDTTVQIWDFSKRGCVLTSEGQAHAVQHCSWHLCGDFMASASVDNTSKTYGILTVRDADIQCVAMKIQSTALSFFRSPTLLSLGLLTRLYLSGMPEWQPRVALARSHRKAGAIRTRARPCVTLCPSANPSAPLSSPIQ